MRGRDQSISFSNQGDVSGSAIRPFSYVSLRTQRWLKSSKTLERRLAFWVFSTAILEQRILTVYQTFEARQARLIVFHNVQDQHLMYQLRLPQNSALPTYLFRYGEIAIDRDAIPITSGAFCDVLSGHHGQLGRVALKRLRTGTEQTSRPPVRPLPPTWKISVPNPIASGLFGRGSCVATLIPSQLAAVLWCLVSRPERIPGLPFHRKWLAPRLSSVAAAYK